MGYEQKEKGRLYTNSTPKLVLNSLPQTHENEWLYKYENLAVYVACIIPKRDKGIEGETTVFSKLCPFLDV